MKPRDVGVAFIAGAGLFMLGALSGESTKEQSPPTWLSDESDQTIFDRETASLKDLAEHRAKSAELAALAVEACTESIDTCSISKVQGEYDDAYLKLVLCRLLVLN